MKALYGLSRESPFVLRDYLEKFKNDLPQDKASLLTTQYLGYGIEAKDVLVSFVPSYLLLKQNLNELYDEIDSVVFVFDSALLLSQVEIEVVDAKQLDDFRWTALDLITTGL